MAGQRKNTSLAHERGRKIIESDLSPYELVRLTYERIYDGRELSKFRHMPDRYHIVDYDAKTLATSKTLKGCIPLINKIAGWGASAVVDEKRLVAYDIKYDTWGAGHVYADHLVSRY